MKQGFVTLLAIFGFVLAATVHAGTGPVDPAARTEFEFGRRAKE